MLKKIYRIGFVGVPPKNLINKLKKQYKLIRWIDLDEPNFNIKNIEIIPKTTCKIIQTIYSNFVTNDLDIFIACTGSSKCDFMEYLVPIFKDLKPNVKIIELNNLDSQVKDQIISNSDLPLIDKFKLICKSITDSIDTSNIKPCKAKAGFWGVPPYDYQILELFPNKTHIFGWTRCMEAKTPSNLELELMVDKNLPTVFYSQLFCAKSIVAKSLAQKYNGLFVESDGIIDNSIREKISAFLELNNCY